MNDAPNPAESRLPMTTFISQNLLKQLHQDTEELIKIVNREFVPLRQEQLFWKPAPDKWSIAQCLEHLNRFGRHYIPAMEAGIRKTVAKKNLPEPSFTSGWLGNFLVHSVQPMQTGSARANWKYPSPKAYNPNRAGTTQPNALPEFLKQQHAMLRILDKAGTVNLKIVRVPVSITNLIKLRLGDCLRFVIVHNQRHIQQAQRVMLSEKFPH